MKAVPLRQKFGTREKDRVDYIYKKLRVDHAGKAFVLGFDYLTDRTERGLNQPERSGNADWDAITEFLYQHRERPVQISMSWQTEYFFRASRSMLTHDLRNEFYSHSSRARRRKKDWSRGTWHLGQEAYDFVDSDLLLSSDGMHLWMWCCVERCYFNCHAQWYVREQFKKLMDDRYRAIVPELSAGDLMSMVYTYHVGDRIKWHSAASEAKRKSEDLRKAGIKPCIQYDTV